MPDAMTLRPILTAEQPILRERTKRVSTFDGSLHQLLDDMLETMRDAPGVGLAANQIGVPLRVAVIEVEQVTELINPEIVRTSASSSTGRGACRFPATWRRPSGMRR